MKLWLTRVLACRPHYSHAGPTSAVMYAMYADSTTSAISYTVPLKASSRPGRSSGAPAAPPGGAWKRFRMNAHGSATRMPAQGKSTPF